MSQTEPVAVADQDLCVVQFGSRTLRGYADHGALAKASENGTSPDAMRLRLEDSGAVESVPLDAVKAVFFVKSFAGNGREELRFHDHLPPQDCLWVRVTFEDGEVLEGLVRNTHHCVKHAGFLLAPIDPQANNWLMYVNKSQVADFRVLGLRPAPKVLAELHARMAPAVQSET